MDLLAKIPTGVEIVLGGFAFYVLQQGYKKYYVKWFKNNYVTVKDFDAKVDEIATEIDKKITVRCTSCDYKKNEKENAEFMRHVGDRLQVMSIIMVRIYNKQPLTEDDYLQILKGMKQ